jgi:hypothetical protein
MAGQSITTAQIQIQELFSALKLTQQHSTGTIRFGLMGFSDSARWLKKPEDVNKIEDLPSLQILENSSGLYPRTNCEQMLHELKKSMTTQFLCNQYSLKSLNIVLLSDGFPTDNEDVLRDAMKMLKSNAVFSDSRCKRFVIRDELEPKKRSIDYGMWFLDEFAGNKDNIVDTDGFSALISRISAELIDGVANAPHSVF